MSITRAAVLLVLPVLLGPLAACGGSDRASPTDEMAGDRDGEKPGDEVCMPSAEVCSGGKDEDCDGDADCADEDCFGKDGCAACGALDLTESEPLALPDGVGGSYMTSINITGFDDGQLVESTDDIFAVCVVMEHSWLRDLEMSITCPSGKEILLQQFLQRTGGLLNLGVPDDSDGVNPTPGEGAEYCWSPRAINPPMLTWGNQHPDETDLPPGDYQPSDSFEGLVGCDLNGDWTIRVTDLWASDNGFIFSWGVRFNPDTVPDCADWPVE
jgi:hypothetical protein